MKTLASALLNQKRLSRSRPTGQEIKHSLSSHGVGREIFLDHEIHESGEWGTVMLPMWQCCQLPMLPIINFCSVANCYGDEAVAPPFVRFTELLRCSFHCSVLRVLKIISSLRCPGYWTYQAMRKQSTSFQDDSATRPRESKSFYL